MMTTASTILVLVVLQRLAELWYASWNTKALKARGAIEYGRGHYPLVVLLHVSWLTAIVFGIQRDPAVRAVPLMFFMLLQALRVWVIATLGPYWTTRLITVPDTPLVNRGPYRFVRHPNYVVVIGEIALLPLVFGQIANAIIFSVLNGAILAWRIHIEEAALGPRRRLLVN
jgi:methyltransferase